MSLINDMLKDLDKRENHTQDKLTVTLQSSPGMKKNQKTYQYIFLSIILILSGILFAIGILLHAKKETSSHPRIKNIKPLFNHAININAISIEMKSTLTQVIFTLSQKTPYALSNIDKNTNQFTLFIKDTALKTALPKITKNSAIKTIHATINKAGTLLQFDLYPGNYNHHITLNPNNTELNLSIEYRPLGDNHQNTSTDHLVKEPVLESVLSEKYQAALDIAAHGKYEEAIHHLFLLLKDNPAYDDVRTSLAAILIEQNKLIEANSLIDQGLQLNPEHLPFVELKARLLTQEGRIKDALLLLQNISPNMEENPDYYSFIAALYEQNNDNAMAMSLYKELLGINPHNGNWWFGLGLSFEKMGHDKEALNAYKKAMREGHLNSETLTYLQKRLIPMIETSNESS